MSCNTGFYRKVNRSQQEAESVAIKHFEDYINFHERYYNDFSFSIKVLQRKIDWIRKGKCPKAIWNYQEDNTMYVPDIGLFEEINNLYNLFRVGAYDTYLYSLSETLTFLKKHKLELTALERKILKEFWRDNPDGMIYLG